MRGFQYPFLFPFLLEVLAYDRWCGKYYEPLAPRTPPPDDTYFHRPLITDQTLLDFHCVTASSIYITGDDIIDPPSVIFDANLTHDMGSPYSGQQGDELEIRVYHQTTLLLSTSATVPLIGHEVPFLPDIFEPQLDPRQLRCIASRGDMVFEDTAELYYLPPNPYGGSSVKLDRRTGGMKVRRQHHWEDLFPFGFYDSINTKEEKIDGSGSSWLKGWSQDDQRPMQTDNFGKKSTVTNRDRLEKAKALGFNIIHPVPLSTSYALEGDDTAIHAYFDDAQELDLGVMYDMRHGFTDLDLVESQVKEFRSKQSLYVWYTSDEPDGPGLPLDSTAKARDLIRKLDPYHPVAIVLNCQDYYFKSYVAGTDILLVDVYSIALNPLWSKKWNSEVTSTFGCSGCDGCQGTFYDLPQRIDEWSERARVMGRRRTLPMWVVPQAFDDHGDEFWWRIPTGDEVAIQILLGVNHGVMGHCAWLASSASEDILRNASFLARHINEQSGFIVSSAHTRHRLATTYPEDPNGKNGLDVSSWTRKIGSRTQTLILAVQMYYTPRDQNIVFSPIGVGGRIKEVLFGNVKSGTDGSVQFMMGRLSIAGVILEYGDAEEVIGLAHHIPNRVPVGASTEL